MSELELLPFRTLLDHVVAPARRHLRTLLLPTALPITACVLVLTVVQLRWIGSFTLAEPADPASFLRGALGVATASLVSLAVYVLTFSALTVAAMEVVQGGERARMGRAWAYVFRPTVLLTLALLGVAGTLSLMMCFLPALFVVPFLSLVLPVMVAEGRSGADAVRRSWELFRFNPGGRVIASPWARLLALLFVGWVISYAVTLGAQLPFLVVQQLILTREAIASQAPIEQMAAVMWLQIPTAVVGSVATAVSWLYPTFGLCLLYRELRRQKEAPDLEAAIAELTA